MTSLHHVQVLSTKFVISMIYHSIQSSSTKSILSASRITSNSSWSTIGSHSTRIILSRDHRRIESSSMISFQKDNLHSCWVTMAIREIPWCGWSIRSDFAGLKRDIPSKLVWLGVGIPLPIESQRSIPKFRNFPINNRWNAFKFFFFLSRNRTDWE